MKLEQWTIEAGDEKKAAIKKALRQIRFPLSRLRPITRPTITVCKQSDSGLFHANGEITLSKKLSVDSLAAGVFYEFGHLVDNYMPLSNAMRQAIITMVGGESWIASEWALSVGETWMFLFAAAYVDPRFVIENSTRWPIHDAMFPQVYSILKAKPVKLPQ